MNWDGQIRYGKHVQDHAGGVAAVGDAESHQQADEHPGKGADDILAQGDFRGGIAVAAIVIAV